MSDSGSAIAGAEGTAVRELLRAGLLELEIPVIDEQVHQLARLSLLLGQWARRINLTGHKSPLEIAARLVLDAAGLAAVLPELRVADRLADLGSGAGFPGLPLAILHPRLAVSLVESRRKRVHFQREARRQLGLDRVRSLLGRAEELPASPHDVVVAQAMTQPDQALELMQRWSRPGGWLVLPAAEQAAQPMLPRGTRAIELREYIVPRTGTRRRLWVARLHPD